jgi:hypothetical protein
MFYLEPEESPLDDVSELELEDGELEVELDESLSEPLLELDRDFRRFLEETDFSFCSFFRFLMLSITSPTPSFPALNLERAFSLSSRIRAANPVGFFVNSSGTSTATLNFS